MLGQPIGQMAMKKATHSVEAPTAASELKLTSRDTSLLFTADRPKVQPPGPASQSFISGRSEGQPPDPTGQPATVVKKHAT